MNQSGKLSLLFFLFIALGIKNLSAQQPIQLSQYMYNKYSINPAYAGLDYSLSVTGVYRNQWSGLEGGPVSQDINAHLPFYIWNGSIGMQIKNDRLGAESNISGSVSYNYVNQSPIGLLSVGMSVGVLQKRLDGRKLRSPDGIYEGTSLNHNDPILTESNVSGIAPIWQMGIYYVHDYFETGLSLGNLPSHFIFAGNAKIKVTHYSQLFFQYHQPINESLDISPTLLVKTDFVQTQMDLSVVSVYNKNIIGGVGFRGYSANSLDAIIIIAGMQLNQHYRLTYSFDLGISGLKNVHEGTHELVLNYNLNKRIGTGLPEKIIYNPRFL